MKDLLTEEMSIENEKTILREGDLLEATVLRSHVSSAQSKFIVSPIATLSSPWRLAVPCHNKSETKIPETKIPALPFTGQNPRDSKESPPVVEEPSPVCAS